jgi:hypothetical protein
MRVRNDELHMRRQILDSPKVHEEVVVGLGGFPFQQGGHDRMGIFPSICNRCRRLAVVKSRVLNRGFGSSLYSVPWKPTACSDATHLPKKSAVPLVPRCEQWRHLVEDVAQRLAGNGELGGPVRGGRRTNAYDFANSVDAVAESSDGDRLFMRLKQEIERQSVRRHHIPGATRALRGCL